jgi:hypothetical protein
MPLETEMPRTVLRVTFSEKGTQRKAYRAVPKEANPVHDSNAT